MADPTGALVGPAPRREVRLEDRAADRPEGPREGGRHRDDRSGRSWATASTPGSTSTGATSSSSSGDEGQTNMFWVLAKSRGDVDGITAALAKAFENAPVPARAMTERQWQLQFLEMLGNVKALLGSVGLATGFALLLITANSLAMSARERRAETAVLRVLGFRRRTIAGFLLGEALVYGLAGAAPRGAASCPPSRTSSAPRSTRRSTPGWAGSSSRRRRAPPAAAVSIAPRRPGRPRPGPEPRPPADRGAPARSGLTWRGCAPSSRGPSSCAKERAPPSAGRAPTSSSSSRATTSSARSATRWASAGARTPSPGSSSGRSPGPPRSTRSSARSSRASPGRSSSRSSTASSSATLVLFWALLTFAPAGVAPPRRAGLLHLGERLQPLRRVGLLGLPRRPLPAGAGAAALRLRRRRRDARRRRRGRADGGPRRPPRPDEPHPPRGAPPRGGRLLRPRPRPPLRRRRHRPGDPRTAGAEPEGVPPGSGVLSGLAIVSRSGYLLAISLFLLFFTVSSTFLYFEQARIVKAAFADSAQRTAFFARIDLWVNLLAAFTQVFLSGRIVRALGVGGTLVALPVLTARRLRRARRLADDGGPRPRHGVAARRQLRALPPGARGPLHGPPARGEVRRQELRRHVRLPLRRRRRRLRRQGPPGARRRWARRSPGSSSPSPSRGRSSRPGSGGGRRASPRRGRRAVRRPAAAIIPASWTGS